jgi:MinD superfamily P-loop ATPase
MNKPIRIAIASGKGGTGKTTIATNLAVALAEKGVPVAYVDCDVEEPNGHIFLNPVIRKHQEVSIPVPEVDETRCTLCGDCGKVCRYSAIVALPKKVLTFPKLCQGCGGCLIACTAGAIREVPRATGVVEEGSAGSVAFLQGRLKVGEAMAPPVIRAVLGVAPKDRTLVWHPRIERLCSTHLREHRARSLKRSRPRTWFSWSPSRHPSDSMI